MNRNCVYVMQEDTLSAELYLLWFHYKLEFPIKNIFKSNPKTNSGNSFKKEGNYLCTQFNAQNFSNFQNCSNSKKKGKYQISLPIVTRNTLRNIVYRTITKPERTLFQRCNNFARHRANEMVMRDVYRRSQVI